MYWKGSSPLADRRWILRGWTPRMRATTSAVTTPLERARSMISSVISPSIAAGRHVRQVDKSVDFGQFWWLPPGNPCSRVAPVAIVRGDGESGPGWPSAWQSGRDPASGAGGPLPGGHRGGGRDIPQL